MNKYISFYAIAVIFTSLGIAIAGDQNAESVPHNNVAEDVPTTRHQESVTRSADITVNEMKDTDQGAADSEMPVSPHQSRSIAGKQPRFEDFDLDQDGSITREESRTSSYLDNRFSEYDRDNDEQLTESEFSSFELLEESADDDSTQ